jgi:hypothetical protein
MVFREIHRVLADDGTLWLNLGDSYSGSGKGGNPANGGKQASNPGSQTVGRLYAGHTGRDEWQPNNNVSRNWRELGAKQLVGIPWRVVLALQADGWILRSDCIWHKPNVMPESVKDRPTKAHEYVFLLTKSPAYYYNHEAIQEPFSDERGGNPGEYRPDKPNPNRADGGALKFRQEMERGFAPNNPQSEDRLADYQPALHRGALCRFPGKDPGNLP